MRGISRVIIRRLPLTRVASDPTSPPEEVALQFNISPA